MRWSDHRLQLGFQVKIFDELCYLITDERAAVNVVKGFQVKIFDELCYRPIEHTRRTVVVKGFQVKIFDELCYRIARCTEQSDRCERLSGQDL